MREKLFYLMTDSKCPAFFLDNEQVLTLADYLIENGVEIPVRCGECRWWKHIGCAFDTACEEDIPDGTDYCSYGVPKEREE